MHPLLASFVQENTPAAQADQANLGSIPAVAIRQRWLPDSSITRGGGGRGRTQLVAGAAYPATTTVEHVRVDHGRANVFVPKQLLHGANVVTVLDEPRGKGVSHGVRPDDLGQAGSLAGLADVRKASAPSAKTCRRDARTLAQPPDGSARQAASSAAAPIRPGRAAPARRRTRRGTETPARITPDSASMPQPCAARQGRRGTRRSPCHPSRAGAACRGRE